MSLEPCRALSLLGMAVVLRVGSVDSALGGPDLISWFWHHLDISPFLDSHGNIK